MNIATILRALVPLFSLYGVSILSMELPVSEKAAEHLFSHVYDQKTGFGISEYPCTSFIRACKGPCVSTHVLTGEHMPMQAYISQESDRRIITRATVCGNCCAVIDDSGIICIAIYNPQAKPPYEITEITGVDAAQGDCCFVSPEKLLVRTKNVVYAHELTTDAVVLKGWAYGGGDVPVTSGRLIEDLCAENLGAYYFSAYARTFASCGSKTIVCGIKSDGQPKALVMSHKDTGHWYRTNCLEDWGGPNALHENGLCVWYGKKIYLTNLFAAWSKTVVIPDVGAQIGAVAFSPSGNELIVGTVEDQGRCFLYTVDGNKDPKLTHSFSLSMGAVTGFMWVATHPEYLVVKNGLGERLSCQFKDAQSKRTE